MSIDISGASGGTTVQVNKRIEEHPCAELVTNELKDSIHANSTYLFYEKHKYSETPKVRHLFFDYDSKNELEASHPKITAGKDNSSSAPSARQD